MLNVTATRIEFQTISKEVDLEGIPKKYQPQDTNINGYSHTYPDGVSLERYYHPQMQRTANEALELIKNNAPKDEIIKKIGQHYQYAANARPYGQINNSLFMERSKHSFKQKQA